MDLFEAGLSLDELANMQGVSPLTDIATFSGGFPEDEDIDAFLEAIYESRK